MIATSRGMVPVTVCIIQLFFLYAFYGSWFLPIPDPGVKKRYRIPDPQHWVPGEVGGTGQKGTPGSRIRIRNTGDTKGGGTGTCLCHPALLSPRCPSLAPPHLLVARCLMQQGRAEAAPPSPPGSRSHQIWIVNIHFFKIYFLFLLYIFLTG